MEQLGLKMVVLRVGQVEKIGEPSAVGVLIEVVEEIGETYIYVGEVVPLDEMVEEIGNEPALAVVELVGELVLAEAPKVVRDSQSKQLEFLSCWVGQAVATPQRAQRPSAEMQCRRG